MYSTVTVETLQGGYPLDPNGSGQAATVSKTTAFSGQKNGRIMIADVGKSTDISSTLMYNRNDMKGGEVILSSGIDPSLPAEIQAAALEAMHNHKFKIKAHTIVISHGNHDSKHLTPEQELKCLEAFLKELKAEGVNLNAAPWVISRHGNTDNIHYHMAIMNTCYDRSRFNSWYLGARATRAAARASLSIGLECPPKAAVRARKTKAPEEVKPNESDKLTTETKEVSKNFYNRRAAIAAARKRKEDEAKKQQTQTKQGESKNLQNRNISYPRGEEEVRRKGFGR